MKLTTREMYDYIIPFLVTHIHMQRMADDSPYPLKDFAEMLIREYEHSFEPEEMVIEDLYSFALFWTSNETEKDKHHVIQFNLYEDISQTLFNDNPSRSQTKGMNNRRIEWEKTGDWYSHIREVQA